MGRRVTVALFVFPASVHSFVQGRCVQFAGEASAELCAHRVRLLRSRHEASRVGHVRGCRRRLRRAIHKDRSAWEDGGLQTPVLISATRTARGSRAPGYV